jgi:hypothetical protein
MGAKGKRKCSRSLPATVSIVHTMRERARLIGNSPSHVETREACLNKEDGGSGGGAHHPSGGAGTALGLPADMNKGAQMDKGFGTPIYFVSGSLTEEQIRQTEPLRSPTIASCAAFIEGSAGSSAVNEGSGPAVEQPGPALADLCMAYDGRGMCAPRVTTPSTSCSEEAVADGTANERHRWAVLSL